jgi:uncharacterized protein YlxW (UPF0749 family)
MSLLVDISTTSLEPGYAEAARNARPDDGGPSRAPGGLGLGLLAVAGVLLATAAVQATRSAPGEAAARTALAEEVSGRTAATDELSAEVARLQSEVARERAEALAVDQDGRRLAERVNELELITGVRAVRGPGVRVTLDDAPPESGDALSGNGTTGPPAADTGRLLDRDVADVVNALWAAGAEAVAVDGQRLTSQTAISGAGDAVLVDFRPLEPPYEVVAIGNPGRLEPAFVDSPTGRRFATYVSLLSIGFSVEAEDELTVPAGVLRRSDAPPDPGQP